MLHPPLGLIRGENAAVEYDTTQFTKYRDTAVALWNAAMEPPSKKQMSNKCRRERKLEKHNEPKTGADRGKNEPKPAYDVQKTYQEGRKKRKRTCRGKRHEIALTMRSSFKNYIDAVQRLPSDKRTAAMEDLVTMIFQVRDCRKDGVGKGGRYPSWRLFFMAAKIFPITAVELLQLFPQYGYWKDLNEIANFHHTETSELDRTIREAVFDIFAKQLYRDILLIQESEQTAATSQKGEEQSERLNKDLLMKEQQKDAAQNSVASKCIDYTPLLNPESDTADKCEEQPRVNHPPVSISLAGKWAPRKGNKFDRLFRASQEIAKRLYQLTFPDKQSEEKEDDITNQKGGGCEQIMEEGKGKNENEEEEEERGKEEEKGEGEDEGKKEKKGEKQEGVKSIKKPICTFYEMHYYSKMISKLNRHLATTEQLMCANQFGSIEFGKVPGRCLNRNKRIFLDISGPPAETDSEEDSDSEAEDAGEDGQAANEDSNDVKEQKKLEAEQALRIHPGNPDRDLCVEHFHQFLKDATAGKVSAKGTSLFVHSLVEQVMDKRPSEKELVLIEAQWKNHEDYFKNLIKSSDGDVSIGKGLVLADVSGSMAGTPMHLSIAMAILVSRLAEGPWKHKFVTFESNPQMVDISAFTSLKSAVLVVQQSPWGGSTDVLAAFGLIINQAAKHKLEPGQLPEWFMIVSDMQFNQAVDSSSWGRKLKSKKGAAFGLIEATDEEDVWLSVINKLVEGNVERLNQWETHHNILKQAFNHAGIKICGKPYNLPMMIYWNARGGISRLPVVASEEGAQMVSGFSASLLKLFMESGSLPECTPWSTMRKALDHHTYHPVKSVLAKVQEAPYFNCYVCPPPPEGPPTKKAKKAQSRTAA